MTVKAWHKTQAVTEQTYYRNLKKLRKEILGNLTALMKKIFMQTDCLQKFEAQTPLPDTRVTIVIRLPNATLKINEAADQQTVQTVLLIL